VTTDDMCVDDHCELCGEFESECTCADTAYIAVVGNGSWGGESAVHAADPATGIEPRAGESRGSWYTSRCGQRFLKAYGGLWSEVMVVERCRRCDHLAKDAR
jgi:hypothetical protein